MSDDNEQPSELNTATALANSTTVSATTPDYSWLLWLSINEEQLGQMREFVREHRGAHHADVRIEVCGESVEMTLDEFCERLGLGYRTKGE